LVKSAFFGLDHLSMTLSSDTRQSELSMNGSALRFGLRGLYLRFHALSVCLSVPVNVIFFGDFSSFQFSPISYSSDLPFLWKSHLPSIFSSQRFPGSRGRTSQSLCVSLSFARGRLSLAAFLFPLLFLIPPPQRGGVLSDPGCRRPLFSSGVVFAMIPPPLQCLSVACGGRTLLAYFVPHYLELAVT